MEAIMFDDSKMIHSFDQKWNQLDKRTVENC